MDLIHGLSNAYEPECLREEPIKQRNPPLIEAVIREEDCGILI
jgi:hypothetical protein